MANETGLLQQEEHDRILREQVLSKRDFVDATPQDRVLKRLCWRDNLELAKVVSKPAQRSS
jgi:hypothetical protein